MNFNSLFESVSENYEDTVAMRRHLHKFPELSFQEVETRKYIISKLKSFGYQDFLENVGKGGIIASVGDATKGKTIALRADFDALPIQEETDFEFKSQVDGVMHACGHDAHTATLLSLAKVLKKHESEIPGKVVFVFQPAEEVAPGGAKGIVEAKVLDGIDAIFGLHLAGGVPYDGKISYNFGYTMAASDRFDIYVQGKGGHGAYPHTSIDATVVGASLVMALQKIVSRSKDPVEPGVITVASFQTSNITENIISDSAHLMGTVRSYDENTRSFLQTRIEEVCAGVGATYNATIKVDYLRGYPAVYNHEAETHIVKEATEGYNYRGVKSMGGEDFAYYLLAYPGSFFYVNAGYAEQDNYPHHHPKFAIDERSMLTGAKAYLAILDTCFNSVKEDA